MLGVFVCFLMSWFYAACNVVNRKLKDVHFAIIGFYHPITGVTISLGCLVIAYLFTGTFLEVHSLLTYEYLLLACFFNFIELNSQNIAFQSDSSGFVSVVGYLVVFYGFLADEFVFKRPIAGLELAGACMIFVVTVGVTVFKLRQRYVN